MPEPFLRGDCVIVKDASGVEHRAVVAQEGAESKGHSFPVVWVAFADGEPIPWPLDSLRHARTSDGR